MNKKYRWIIVLLVLTVCAFAGCQKQQEKLLLYEDKEEAARTAEAEGTDGQKETAGQEAGNGVTAQTGGAVHSGVTGQTAGDNLQNDATQSAGDPVKSGVAEQTTGAGGSEDTAQTAGNAGTKQPGEAAVCVVHVCGAVQSPGVYTLAEGSRIYEAVAAAGGLLPEADEAYLNQASCVTDGEQIYVPTQQEVLEQSATLVRSGQSVTAQTESGAKQQDAKVNLNTATKEQLCTLPGIGESKAQSIISYRETQGAYGQIEDVMNVEGIKDGLFQKIRDRITV